MADNGITISRVTDTESSGVFSSQDRELSGAGTGEALTSVAVGAHGASVAFKNASGGRWTVTDSEANAIGDKDGSSPSP